MSPDSYSEAIHLLLLHEPACPRITGFALLPATICGASASASRLYEAITGSRFRITATHAPLSTLKSHLTVSTPRLSTGCLLGFARAGLSPACVINAELAHAK
jgi:hypothetical protein